MERPADKIYDVLKRYWGFTEFRPVQERIIRSVMDGRDTLALMPTGGGKSLTYQIPGLAQEGLCIVVTPLIALMKDQVDRLRARHIPAVAIHSGLSPRAIDIALDNCVYGDVKFLYVAPERLATEAFRLRVVRMNVSLVAVDEAHCISQWGYDFRPSYLRIAELREKLPGVPVLALTASATKLVAEDIMRHLRFAEPHILRSSFARPNLSYSVRHTDDKNGQLLRLVRNVPGSGIVYVRTREGTEQVADMLRREGITAAAYHGGMGHAERSLRQEEWVSGRTRVMVATNAFGMGIDKPDVRNPLREKDAGKGRIINAATSPRINVPSDSTLQPSNKGPRKIYLNQYTALRSESDRQCSDVSRALPRKKFRVNPASNNGPQNCGYRRIQKKRSHIIP